jgi:hypothetical protein
MPISTVQRPCLTLLASLNPLFLGEVGNQGAGGARHPPSTVDFTSIFGVETIQPPALPTLRAAGRSRSISNSSAVDCTDVDDSRPNKAVGGARTRQGSQVEPQVDELPALRTALRWP